MEGAETERVLLERFNEQEEYTEHMVSSLALLKKENGGGIRGSQSQHWQKHLAIVRSKLGIVNQGGGDTPSNMVSSAYARSARSPWS